MKGYAMKGYAMIEALGQVEDKYVEEAGRGGAFRHSSYRIAAIAVACLLLMIVPSATVLTNDHFVFGQDWQCPVDFQEPVEESVIYRSAEREEPREYRELEMSAFAYEGWTQPVERMCLSGFFGTQGNGSFSDHINIAGEKGDEVFAVEDGTVVEAGFEAKCGNYVVLLLQDDVKVKYGHLQDVYVAEDQEVERGSAIGTVGQTGIATGPNLSLTLYVEGEAVNPLKEGAYE